MTSSDAIRNHDDLVHGARCLRHEIEGWERAWVHLTSDKGAEALVAAFNSLADADEALLKKGKAWYAEGFHRAMRLVCRALNRLALDHERRGHREVADHITLRLSQWSRALRDAGLRAFGR